MSQFSKFKLLLALKWNLIGGQFYKDLSNFGYFKKWKKSKKIGAAEEIGCKNDIVLSKIGREFEVANVSDYQNDIVLAMKMDGWMDGWV